MKFKLSARGIVFIEKPHEEIAVICKKAGFRGVEGADTEMMAPGLSEYAVCPENAGEDEKKQNKNKNGI